MTPIHVLSLGAGVQSTTVALMSARGELPPLDCAIFADTQAEPAPVYRHLEWLETQLPFPIHRVTAGNLREVITSAMRGERRLDARPPFFTLTGDELGMLNRQCTHRFKVAPIMQRIRELLGIGPRGAGPKQVRVVEWFGISFDEVGRMRDSPRRWVEHRYPLVDLRMTRRDCLTWCERHGYPRPPKSACTFCPYHDDAMWREMKRSDPESFADAVAVDDVIRPGIRGPNKPKGEQWFLHRAAIPLREVDFSTLEDHGQQRLFENECEGHCGV